MKWSKKKADLAKPVMVRLYKVHRELLKKHARAEKVKIAEIHRRAIEEYDLNRQ